MKTIKLIAFAAILLIAGKTNAENISTLENCIRLNKDSTLHAGTHGSIEDYKTSSKVRGYSILAGGGAILIPSGNFDMLNQRLSKNNYATISTQYSTWNISILHAMYKNTVFSINFGGILKKNTVSDSSKTTMTGSTVNLALGKVIYHGNRMLVYPMIGADFGSFDVHSHFTGANTASDISGNNTFRAFDFSLNIDYLLRGFDEKIDWNSTSNKSFPIHGSGILSLSLGYVYCPANTYWTDNNYDISSRFNTNVNYPANVIGSVTPSNFSMLYASLKIGFGSFYK